MARLTSSHGERPSGESEAEKDGFATHAARCESRRTGSPPQTPTGKEAASRRVRLNRVRHLRALAGVRLSAMLGGTSQKGTHAYHNGLLRVSVNEESMTLKLTLIRSFSLTFISTECSR